MTEQELKPVVLVVDDEPRILDSIRSLLEEKFRVISTTDANQALGLLGDNKIAAILADQRMPGLTGDQFLAKARELSDATRILLTGYADIDALIRAVNDGQVYTYVTKPWEPGKLKVTVDEAVAYSQELARRKEALQTVARQQEALARSESAFRRQTKVLQSIIDSMADGVIVVDKYGDPVVVNPEAERMLGPAPQEIIERKPREQFGVFHPATAAIYPSEELPLVRGMRGENVDDLELFIRNAENPGGIFVNVNVRPLKDDSGNTTGAVGVLRNNTGAKRSEELLRRAKDEAERANRAKSEFLSRMSHELRTPLNSILGFAQLLEMTTPRPDQADNIQHILRGGQHLLSLINEVLDVARIEAGRLSLSLEPVKLPSVIQEALDLIHPMALQRNIVINKGINVESGWHVKADLQRLRQVLLNLLSNAVKYNVENGRIEINCEKRGDGSLRIAVSDTGIGIAAEDQERLFRPFERLHDDAGRHIEGTGLGLALCKGLVEAMGGRIGADSSMAQGSTFWVDLVLLSQAVDAEEDGAPEKIRECSVLYIEDNPSNVTLMRGILSHKSDVRFSAATDGRTGLAFVREHKPDLVLLDLHLPDISGAQVLDQMKKDPETSSIPVVIVTADATPAQRDRLLQAGARDFLTKPLDVRALLRLFDDIQAIVVAGSVKK